MGEKRLMVMAGGTGGHLFPGLAVAHYLMSQGWQVRWLGTADRMEADLIPRHGIKIDFIHISGVRGKGINALLMAPMRIFKAVCQARAIMKQYQPDVVLGMGGYVSGPGGLAAWICNIPVVIHEQNGVAGLTNKGLSKIANKVLQAFPGAFPHADVVGNPVRADVLALPKPAERLAGREGPIRVLVFGGSQGARILNQTMPQVAAILRDNVAIWHQVGKGSAKSVNQAYAAVNREPYCVAEFIEDIAAAYAWADVVVCRAGALTVSEIAVAGLPAIFVPFAHKDRQQYWNALPLEQVGAAKIFEQSEFNADVVASTLAAWDRQTLLHMAEKSRAIAIPDATERVARQIICVAE